MNKIYFHSRTLTLRMISIMCFNLFTLKKSCLIRCSHKVIVVYMSTYEHRNSFFLKYIKYKYFFCFMDIRVLNLSAYWLLRTLKNYLIKKKN